MGRCTGFWSTHADGSDSDGEDDHHQQFLPIDHDGDNVLQWELGQGRVSLASALTAEAPSISGFVSDGVVPTLVDLPPQWNDSSLDPMDLLRRALREHHPEMYVPAQRLVKRQRCKQQAPLGRLLRMLQDDPLCLQHKHLDLCQYTQARDEFSRVYARAAGQPVITARTAARQAYIALTAPERAAWHVVSQVAQIMYIRTPGSESILKPSCLGYPSPPEPNPSGKSRGLPESFDAFGLLLTWQISLGIDDAAVREIFRQRLSVDEQVTALLALPTHQWHFQAFRTYVQSLASQYSFPSWAASMELSTLAAIPGRVHLHAFVGPAFRDNGFFQGGVRKACVQTSTLLWNGHPPHVSLMQVKRRRTVSDCVVGGMYYVLANKVGSLFRAGSDVLFQDRDLRRFG